MSKKRLIVLATVIYIFLEGFIIEPNSVVIKKYQVKNLLLSGTKIVFLSDFHLKNNNNNTRKRLNKIVGMVKDEKPNLVLLGGDYIQGPFLDKNLLETFSMKIATIGIPVYAVLGDSDLEANGRSVKSVLNLNGIRVLDNENKKINLNNRYVYIVGISDLKRSRPNISKAMPNSTYQKIVITHNPDIYYDIISNVALILAGHTHGGQFVIPMTPPLFVDSKYGSKFASGLIEDSKNNKMIISKGLGTTGVIPMRFNCKPEIVVVEFVE